MPYGNRVWQSLFPVLVLFALFLKSSHADIFATTSGARRYIVLQIERLGLANRLRTIADWHNLALLSHRTLLLSWLPTPDCNGTFAELFDEIPVGLKVLPFALPKGEAGVVLVQEMAAEQGLSFLVLEEEPVQRAGCELGDAMWANGFNSFVVSSSKLMSDVQVLFSSYDGIISMEGVKCQQYLTKHTQFLANMVPNAFATKFVANLLREYFADKLMVGIHVRSFEAKFDWEVVPPTGFATQALAYGDGAPLEKFEEIMTNIREAFSTTNATGHRQSSVRFFIASNSADVKEHFLAKFPDSVTMSGVYDRSSKEGVSFALLEMLVLAESSLIVHTYGSSFAAEAALIRQVPIVGIWGGFYVHLLDTRLPFCGHMQFVKSFGSQGMHDAYKEGTEDKRNVRGKLVPMVPCHHLVEWGIPEVFCTVTDSEAETLE